MTCAHGFVGACAFCDGSGQLPARLPDDLCQKCGNRVSECICALNDALDARPDTPEESRAIALAADRERNASRQAGDALGFAMSVSTGANARALEILIRSANREIARLERVAEETMKLLQFEVDRQADRVNDDPSCNDVSTVLMRTRLGDLESALRDLAVQHARRCDFLNLVDFGATTPGMGS